MSFKNDIIKGGAFMQDSSYGNPFPQSAVQEYRILTQNYNGYDGWMGAPGEPSKTFGNPTSAFGARKYQIGTRVTF